MSYKPSAFTGPQARIICHLGAAGAIDRDTAIAITSPGAAAVLINGYFCAKRTDKPKGGSQHTLYWLTERGQRAWKDIKS